MATGTKLVLGACAVVAAGQLWLAVDDPSRAGTWLGLVAMGFVAGGALLAERDRRRRDGR